MTVYFAIDGASTASSTDYDSPVLSQGYLTFNPYQTEVYVAVEAIDDTILEDYETLVVRILPHSSYYIGSELATTYLHDGEHGTIAGGFTVEWKDEYAWRSSPASEVLWYGDDHRWTAQIPSEIESDVTAIEWLSRAHGATDNVPWVPFAVKMFYPGNNDHRVIGFPGIGHWDIMYRVWYGAYSWLQATTSTTAAGNAIESITWEKGNNEQTFRDIGDEIEVFPEMPRHDYTGIDYDRVKIKVKLQAEVPETKSARVKLKDFDPDHPADISLVEKHTADARTFDPNDTRKVVPNPEGGQPFLIEVLTKHPWDNRLISGELATPGHTGGTILFDDILEFQGGTETKRENTAIFSIYDAMAGNNFIVVGAAIRPDEAENIVDKVDFDTDAMTLKYPWREGTKTVPEWSRTKLLTVWRTLWVELDSMKAPADLVADGPFDQPPGHPQYDKSVGDLPNVPIDLLAPNFLPAKIEVRQLPESPVSGAPDTQDQLTFWHYLTDMPGWPEGHSNTIRDVQNNTQFWVVHVVHAYEHNLELDFDPEGPAYKLGHTELNGGNLSGSAAYVFAETIRDRASQPDSPDFPATVEEEKLLKRTVLHEVGHLVGLGHGVWPPAKANGIMSPWSQSWTDDEAQFTLIHYGRLQWITRPEAFVSEGAGH